MLSFLHIYLKKISQAEAAVKNKLKSYLLLSSLYLADTGMARGCSTIIINVKWFIALVNWETLLHLSSPVFTVPTRQNGKLNTTTHEIDYVSQV